MGDGKELPSYVNERLRRSEQVTLAAVDTAVGCARLFIENTLTRWQATPILDDALLVGSELVTNAVTATGVTGERPRWTDLARLNLIHLHLLAFDSSVVIEVWDVSRDEPVQRADAWEEDAEGGRGILLVQELSHRWGSCLAESGKVVWAELALPLQALPRRRRSPVHHRVPGVHADRELLQRILAGLTRL